MTEDRDLVELEQKTYREYMQDGLTFLFLGVLLFITSALSSQPSFLPIFIVVMMFIPQAVERIKERFTYPRLGYVQLREEDPRSTAKGIIRFVVFVIVASFVVLILYFGPSFEVEIIYRALPVIFGIIMIGPSLWLVEKTGSRTYYLFGVLVALSGLGFALFDFNDRFLGFSLFLFLWAGILTVIGLIMFVRFISNYPIIEPLGGHDPEK